MWFQAEYIVSRLQDTVENLRRINDQFDSLSRGEMTEEQATRQGLFVEHTPMTVDWEIFASSETIVHTFLVVTSFIGHE